VGERRIPMHKRSVDGIRAGRKTQTRRIVKPQPEGVEEPEEGFVNCVDGYCVGRQRYLAGGPESPHVEVDEIWFPAKCPYGKPGDTLLVAEAWRTEARFDDLKPSELPKDARIHYEADGEKPEWAGRYRNQRFMCNWMCRIRRELTGIRVERVQDISKADVLAEGVTERDGCPLADVHVGWHEPFAKLWDDTNGEGAWKRNDWVWVVEFEKETA